MDGCHDFNIGYIKFETLLIYKRDDVEQTVVELASMELEKVIWAEDINKYSIGSHEIW